MASTDERFTSTDAELRIASRGELPVAAGALAIHPHRRFGQYRDRVLAAIRLRLSNGRLEGLNNNIGVTKHRANRFHAFAALAASSAAPIFSSSGHFER